MRLRQRLLIVALCAGLALAAGACGSSGSVRRVGRVDTGTAYDIAVRGGYAYVTNNEGLVIIAISRPDRPKQVGLIEVGEAAFGVALADDLAYIGGGSAGFTVADIRDPSQPRKLGSYRGDVTDGMCVAGSIAYVSYYTGALGIIDVSDAAAPTLLARYAGKGMGKDAACRGEIVYFAAPDQGLHVVDVSDPAHPAGLGIVPQTEGAVDIDIAGDLLFLAWHGNGVRILDISDWCTHSWAGVRFR